MPWSNGVYTRSNGVFTGATVWASDASVGTNITTSHHDTHDQDIATGLNNCVTVDGLNKIAANFVSTVDGAYNLGSASFRWGNAYFSGTVAGGTFTGSTLSSPTLNGTVAGGTFTGSTLSSPTLSGAVTMSAGAINEAEATLASGSTVAIGAATANYISISGTTTITAFDTIQAGTQRTLMFQGVLTLTYNGTSLILPGAANITTAGGDTAIFVSEGSGNWRCIAYTVAAKASTNQVFFASPSSPGSTASVTPVMLGVGNTCNLTVASTRVLVIFSGSTLNITSGNGGSLQLSYGTGTAPINGAALAGTQVGNKTNIICTANSQALGYCLASVITGLALGTAYWFDIAYAVIGGGASNPTEINFSIVEV